jgi:predicted kinase
MRRRFFLCIKTYSPYNNRDMNRQTLFLMVGYPGSGKTTASKIIHKQTSAVHLWADAERRKMFEHPTHSRRESKKLYDHLNTVTSRLLNEGKSVIFDTNFNFYKDRQCLREIATKHGAQTIVIWITTPKAVARQRAVHDRQLRNGYQFVLPEADFERMSNHLQEPRKDEYTIELAGQGITAKVVADTLSQVAL